MSCLQLTLFVKPLEGHIADLDGQVIFSYRRPPATAAARHEAAACPENASMQQSQSTGNSLAASLAVMTEQAFVPTMSMYFRGGELGVRWIPYISGKDLLWQ